MLLRNNEAIIGARTESRERELSSGQFPRRDFPHLSDLRVSQIPRWAHFPISQIPRYAAAVIYERASLGHDPIISLRAQPLVHFNPSQF